MIGYCCKVVTHARVVSVLIRAWVVNNGNKRKKKKTKKKEEDHATGSACREAITWSA